MVKRGRTMRPGAIIAVLIAVIVAVWQNKARHQEPAPVPPVTRTAPAAPPATPDARNTSAPAPSPSDRVARATKSEDEQRAVIEVLALIDNGGPFPYAKDGSTFSNRERVLPQKPRGYYREYTVPTPGEGDRGARRIVRGQNGETYYSRDHYRTFVRLDE